MPAAPHPLVIDLTEPFTLRLNWRNPNNSNGTPGAPINLAGATARLVITGGQRRALLTLDSPTDVVLGGSPYNIVASAPVGRITASPGDRATWDLHITMADGTPRHLLTGSVTFK